MDRRVPFFGILSSQPSENPEWIKTFLFFFFFLGKENSQHIWEAILVELLSIGLSKSKQALLSGCSAGGLATLIHCDDFRGLLPRDSRIQLSNVMLMQDLAKSLHKDCVARKEPAKCLFPEKIIKHVSRVCG
ncbi:pectin acetylesterase 4-like isoform X2 [Rosa rugosa]|uniref:pectin acetylesterase 4-like isoform X2 n=1 Tax=Rosa rugosa TaxID=74645 RepID=UPI002B413297|nr:pectin acetylesterase 4-like isoform X2 [Rosa rugosa]